MIEPDLDLANELVGSQIGINKRLDVIHGDPQDEDLLRELGIDQQDICLLYTSPSPRDLSTSRMPSSA